MKNTPLLILALLALTANLPARAQESTILDVPAPQPQGEPQKPDQKPDQKPEQKPDQQKPDQKPDQQSGQKGGLTRFNLVCYYFNKHNPEDFRSCKIATTFDKAVTIDGGEVVDDSPEPTPPLSGEVPSFDVDCGQTPRWADHARRFTTLLSTRIQALSGPHPAITLPRGALSLGFHVADSRLEVDTGSGQLHAKGQCYIWTGRP